ncbi:MAG: L,D-transpeptidase family protein [Ktedonobacteraceae bacterium]|nr:L,D-transpeptidase family protein [Ktedonobacteraceae bacterium]MBV9019878.1 L,D-transpeptidase family protein [Ktedonobacteraceae bacterium]
MIYAPRLIKRNKRSLFLCMVVLAMLLFSACSGSPQTHQGVDQDKTTLDTALVHAQSIGVPSTLLQSIKQQETQLSATHVPLSVFGHQSATDYYTNLAQRYQMLAIQVQGLETQTTQHLDYVASLDLQTFESLLAQRQAQGFVETKVFADQLKQDQNLLSQAQTPKDYLQVSENANRSMMALHLMGPAYNALVSLQQAMKQLQNSRLDITALQQQEQYDLQTFRTANKPEDFSQLIDLVNAQLQQTAAFSVQAIPYVGTAKLKEFAADIANIQQYGQSVTTYQQHLQTDQAALSKAKTLDDLLKVSTQIDNDLASIQLPLLRSEAHYLLKQYQQEVNNWGNSHLYHDSYDGGVYQLDYEYNEEYGIGSDLDAAVQSAQTSDDYQAAIDLISNDMLNLKAMEADSNDTTSWDQPHNTDIQLMKNYNLMAKQVFVVSLIEQTLRFYQNGKLIRAFHITSGQYAKPSPPGLWSIFSRESPTVFKSSEPKGSAFWYPDTNINFAMEYHDGGYFFHDSWWRVNYGPGTNFPHYDSGGDETFAGNGSHGCINMQEDEASWLYNNSSYGASVIVY